MKGCTLGGTRTLVVTIKKMKNDRPTVIEIMGNRYVLEPEKIVKKTKIKGGKK